MCMGAIRVQCVIVDPVSSLQIEDCESLRTAVQGLVNIEDHKHSNVIAHDGDGSILRSVESFISALPQGVTKDRFLSQHTRAAPSPCQFWQEVLQNRKFSLDCKEALLSWWTAYQKSFIDHMPRLNLFGTRRNRATSCKSEIQPGKCSKPFTIYVKIQRADAMALETMMKVRSTCCRRQGRVKSPQVTVCMALE